MLEEIAKKLDEIEAGRDRSTIVMIIVRVSPKLLLQALRRDLVSHLSVLTEAQDANIQPIGEDGMLITLPEMPVPRSITVVRKIAEEVERFEKTLPHTTRIVHEMLTTPKDVHRIRELLKMAS